MAFKGDLEALILAVLADHALHGYEISKRIRSQSQEVLKYGEGQLYPALHKLEESGFIEAEWMLQDGKPDRKVYNNGSIAIICGRTKRSIISLRKLAYKSLITIDDMPF